ncbi:MAG: hypothetical protein R6V19_10125 [Armatimonadota bacterium]
MTTEATFLVPLLIEDAGAARPRLERISGEGFEGVRAGDIVIAFNNTGAQITIPTPQGEAIDTTQGTTVVRDEGSVQQVFGTDKP